MPSTNIAPGPLGSWLLVRTGSLRVTIFCHAIYNSVVAIALLYIALPG